MIQDPQSIAPIAPIMSNGHAVILNAPDLAAHKRARGEWDGLIVPTVAQALNVDPHGITGYCDLIRQSTWRVCSEVWCLTRLTQPTGDGLAVGWVVEMLPDVWDRGLARRMRITPHKDEVKLLGEAVREFFLRSDPCFDFTQDQLDLLKVVPVLQDFLPENFVAATDEERAAAQAKYAHYTRLLSSGGHAGDGEVCP